jgi:hypothetical protein
MRSAVALRALTPLGLVLLVSCDWGNDKGKLGEEETCVGDSAVIEIGRLVGDQFTALGDGDEISVVHGVQGGTWIMPSIRLIDAKSGGDVNATLTLIDGTLLGEIRRPKLRFTTSADGSLVLQFLPVPVSNAPGTPALETVDAAAANLELVYSTTCGDTLTQHFAVTLHVVPGSSP